MKQLKITCDACGKSNTDAEFYEPPLGSFHPTIVEIKYDLSNSNFSELDKIGYANMTLDLCGECVEKFRKVMFDRSYILNQLHLK